MRLARLIGPELTLLLKEEPEQVRELLGEIHPEDVADVLAEVEPAEAARALKSLPTVYAARVFERFEEEHQVLVAKSLGLDSTVKLVTEMDADDLADFVGALPPDTVTKLLGRLEKVDPEIAEGLEELARWPENSAGGLMTTDFVTVAAKRTVQQTIAELRRRAAEVEVLDVVFVVDPSDRVQGFVTMRRLLLSDPERPIGEVMHQRLVSVHPELDQEEVARTLAKYDLNVLPVIDHDNRILGVITADDVFDVIEEEVDEDVQKMGAIEPFENAYFNTSFAVYLKKRLPWLLVLFIGGFFTASAMEAFDSVLATVTRLAVYVPMLISAGGNSGSQSATLVIRGLAVGDIETQDWHKVMLRELGQGITLGGILALAGVGRALLVGDGVMMAVLVAATIICIVVMGCVVGAMMPIFLHRLGVDPASSSTPFIATLVDVMGIVVYLSLAQWLMGQTADALAPPTGAG
jgi:magnesium transporter